MQIVRRTVLATAFSLATFLGFAPPADAGLLDDLNEFVAENLDALADQLSEAPNRLARQRVRTLRRIERLAKRDRGSDVVGAAAQARQVVGLLERSYNCTGPEDEAARELMDELLVDLEADLGSLREEVDLGVSGLTGIGALPRPQARAAERLLATANTLAERAATENRRQARASLVARAARLAGRARKIVRRAGGVAGPYEGIRSETGTAAGTATLLRDGVHTATTVVGSLLTTTGRGDLSSLRLEGTFDAGTVLRVGIPTTALFGVVGGTTDGALAIGRGVDDVRVELETAAGTVEALSGTLRLESLDLRAKRLVATVDALFPGTTDPVAATFDLADFLLVR